MAIELVLGNFRVNGPHQDKDISFAMRELVLYWPDVFICVGRVGTDS